MKKVFLVVALIAMIPVIYLALKWSPMMGGGLVDPEQNDLPTQTETTNLIEPTSANSIYLPFQNGVLNSQFTGRRVLFFYANWCPTCRPADRNIEASLDQFPSDLQVIRVNYNDSDTDAEEKSLAEQYQITYQHTFVQIDNSGEVVTRWNGGSFAEILTNLK